MTEMRKTGTTKRFWVLGRHSDHTIDALITAVNKPEELQFARSLCPLLLIINQTIPSMHDTRNAKEKPQDCRQPIQPTQGM